jgi:PilZ domain-containing protein
MLIAARGCRAHRTAIPEGYACLAAHNNPQLVQVSHAETQRPASPYREQRRGNASIPDSEAIGFRARIGQRHGDSADFVTLNAPGLSGFLIFVAMLGRLHRWGSMGMEERRKFPRTEINEPAFVSSGGSVMRCTLLNISAEGCAIEVAEPAFVPSRFRLVMANDSSIVRECQIAWIQQNRIGLAFVEAPQAAMHAAAKPVPA